MSNRSTPSLWAKCGPAWLIAVCLDCSVQETKRLTAMAKSAFSSCALHLSDLTVRRERMIDQVGRLAGGSRASGSQACLAALRCWLPPGKA